jgi:hypothetical protein
MFLRLKYRWVLTLATLAGLLLASGAGDKWRPV